MKKCTDCEVAKPDSDYSLNRRRKDGREGICKTCVRARSAVHYRNNAAKRKAQTAAWLKVNPGKNAKYSATWRHKNPGAQDACNRVYREKNLEHLRAVDKLRREANLLEFLERERASYQRNKATALAKNKRWREANKPVVSAHAAKRRADRIVRTPKWLTVKQIAAIVKFYECAASISAESGVPHHVDHIVPLRGRTVSGLHVPWNLQILPATVNLSKNNRLWPDMP